MAKLRVDKIAAVGVSTETTGSVFFDGTGDFLSVADSDDWHYGSGDFTAECWVYPTASPNQPMLVGQWSGATGSTTLSWVMMLSNDSNRNLRGLMSSNTSAVDFDLVSSASLGLNQWSHCAFVKNGSTFTLYLNGTNVASTTDSDALSNATNALTIGATSTGAQPFQGYLSNVRVCKGHAVYTEDFIPPTRELEVHPGPDDDRTVLLACYDGENIFAEKTGRHIIAAYGDRTSSPTPTATDSPVGVTTNNPGLIRDVDNTFGPVFQGGAAYNSQNWLTLPKGTTTQRNRGRGVFGGGNPGSASNVMQYVQIQSQGNALDFGDLTVARQASGLGGATRGVFGGNAHPNGDTMDFITIASTGNAVDFGNLQSSLNGRASAANLTRGIFAGGGTPTVSNEIDFITIATLGNAIDFGNLFEARRNHAGVASPTRAVFAGGDAGSTTDTIDFVTIATTGNATDFGNLSTVRETAGGASSSTRGIFMGGYTSPGDVDVIEYITIATTGNATDFGNLSAARRNGGSVSNNIRGLYAGGHPSVNTIEFVTIASTGDANDFGDLLVGQRINPNHVSDSHGGLS